MNMMHMHTRPSMRMRMLGTARLVRHSIRAIARYKMRSGFIMLGSFVGVAALTLVISVGEGVERKVIQTVRQLFGASSIVVVGRGSQLMGGAHRGNAERLTLDDMAAVAKELPEIDAWDPQQAFSAAVRHEDASTTARVLGQSERSERVWARSVSRGEYFDASAVSSSARVAVIGETVARKLFGSEDPLDAEILIGAESASASASGSGSGSGPASGSVPFRVIGILERFGTDLHGMDRDNEIVVPISTVMRRLMNVDTIGAAKLLVRDPAHSEDTAKEIKRILRARHAIAADRPDDFNIMTAAEVQKMVSFVQRILFLYLPLVAGVAMIVAGIVAASLMLASVSQRVGEIGLRRAVGARPEDIRLQFLIETAVTTLSGGLAGIIFAYIVAAHLGGGHFQLGQIFSWKAVVLGIVVSIVTGLIAGVAPARRAARLQPADALR
jgi:putative ABC transport system permease protein